MKYFWSMIVASSFYLMQTQYAHGQGRFEDYCSLTKTEAMFSAAESSYQMSGNCYDLMEKKYWSPKTAKPWYAKGAYRPKDGYVSEVFNFFDGSEWIKLSQYCKSDPWLSETQCTESKVANTGWVEVSRSVGNIVRKFAMAGPLTAHFSYPRGPLLAKRDADLKAEADAAAAAKAAQDKRRIQQASQPLVPYAESMRPIVKAPTIGQRFFDRNPVPITLAPPPQWPQTNIDTKTGAVVRTAQSVQAYLVNIQRKNPQGHWVAHTTIPIGAAQAESAAGYVGFGNGTPPGGITAPGVWRLNAQVSSPQQSGWSDWVEFNVMTPPTSTNVQKGISGWK